jgi:protein-disulfide isomerase
MARVWANRAVFVLGSLGVFIALVIGIAHASGASLPCGAAQSGCDIIGSPEHSRWLGIPIAFYGLAAYLSIVALAWRRENEPSESRLAGWLFVLLGAGMLISWALIAYGISTLHTTCRWCIANAVTMSLALIVHTLGMSKPQTAARPIPGSLFPAILGAAALAGGALGMNFAAHAQIDAPPVKPGASIYRAESHIIGKKDAPITIVEFMDLYCPTCRMNHAWLMERLNGPLAGKVRLIVRHYPLTDDHPMALRAALLMEWAAAKGKLVEYIDQVHAIKDPESIDPLLLAVSKAGLSAREAVELLNDPVANRKYADAVAADINDANKLGVDMTPWWFIEYPDKTIASAIGSAIQKTVEGEQFQRRLADSR